MDWALLTVTALAGISVIHISSKGWRQAALDLHVLRNELADLNISAGPAHIDRELDKLARAPKWNEVFWYPAYWMIIFQRADKTGENLLRDFATFQSACAATGSGMEVRWESVVRTGTRGTSTFCMSQAVTERNFREWKRTLEQLRDLIRQSGESSGVLRPGATAKPYGAGLQASSDSAASG